jgi:hypothetical protein
MKAYINSWLRLLPDFEIVRWDETNFDVDSINFCKQAYCMKKWAFVSDYVRLFALHEFGGVYLDTDVEVIKSFNSVLADRKLILGTNDMGGLVSSFIASEPGHPFVKTCLEMYVRKDFIRPDGRPDLTPNTSLMKKILIEEYGYDGTNKRQTLPEGIEVYPDDFFQVKSLVSGKRHLTGNSCMIHHQTLTWVPFRVKLMYFLRTRLIVAICGPERYFRFVSALKDRKNDLFKKSKKYESGY